MIKIESGIGYKSHYKLWQLLFLQKMILLRTITSPFSSSPELITLLTKVGSLQKIS